MKNIVIYGAGTKGVFLSQLFRRDEFMGEDFRVLFFCDTYKKAGTFVEGIEVISPSRLKEIEHTIGMVVISSIALADEIQDELIKVKTQADVFTVPEYVFHFMWNGLFDSDCNMPFFIRVEMEKPRMPYLEIKIVRHCNLNCKGCTALANIAEEKYMGLDEFEASMRRLKEIYWGIRFLKLFGGEPLLHPNLKEFVSAARRYFPDSELVVHSNGLLIPDMDDSLFAVMRAQNAYFEFTQYPPTGFKKRMIVKTLEKGGVEYKFRSALYEFQKTINIAGDYDADEVYKTCAKCINLVQGTLSCGLGWRMQGLEEKYGVRICDDKFQNCINIFDTELNGWEMNKVLDRPSHLCKYCAFMNVKDVDKRIIRWECGGPYMLSDWVYDGNY